MTSPDRWTVVKVGGSLLDWPELPARLTGFLDRHQGERLVLIVGGGAAADFVRDLDRMHAMGEAKAHALAVRSLDLTARALAAIVPGLTVVETIAELHNHASTKNVPVLAPRMALEDDDRCTIDPLPTSWDVTTDAIAARIATRLHAEALILLKSTSAPPGTTRDQSAKIGLVDPRFPHEARAIPRVILENLRGEGPESETILEADQ